MDNIERILSSIENIERLGTAADVVVPRIPKTYTRNEYNQNPYELYNDNEFKRRFRFSKNSVLNVLLPLIAANLEYQNNRGLPIQPEIQILIALRFYATGCFHCIKTVCGDLLKFSQSTVCLIINRVSAELSKLLPQFINFPTPNQEKIQEVKRKFEELGRSNNHAGLNNIVGAVDCTHIKINRPRGLPNTEAYRNRKTYFSINAQVVVGPNMEIFDIVTRWPGGSHDSRIFRNSQTYAQLSTGIIPGVLVGDSGYPSLPFMLTPLLQPNTRAENNYNYAQIRTRNIIERFFGVWKRKFPCLQLGLRSKLQNVSNIIIACAVLHNIGIRIGDSYETQDELPNFPDLPDMEGNALGARAYSSAEGLAFRQSIIQFN